MLGSSGFVVANVSISFKIDTYNRFYGAPSLTCIIDGSERDVNLTYVNKTGLIQGNAEIFHGQTFSPEELSTFSVDLSAWGGCFAPRYIMIDHILLEIDYIVSPVH